MKPIRTLSASLVVALAVITSSVKSQDIYLWFDGVKGSSQVTWPGIPNNSATHIVNLQSVGVTAACASCAVVPSPGGKVSPGKLVFNLNDGQAMQQLKTLLFSQQTTTKPVCFVFRKSTGGTTSGASFYYITLGQVRVLEVDEAATAGSGSSISYQVSLAYGQIQYNYKPQKADGSFDTAIITGWDFIKNVSLNSLTRPEKSLHFE